MSERIEMSLDDVKKFTAGKAHQSEQQARRTIKEWGNTGAKSPYVCAPGDEGSASEEKSESWAQEIAEMGEGDGY